MTTNTDIIRLKLAAITDLVADIAEACTDIDNEIPPEEPEEPEEPPEEPEEPETPALPAPVDCLAGTTPPATNMIAAEENEAPWLAARAAFRSLMANSPSGSILMIGDSQIATMDEALVSPHAVNLGISGESSRQLLYRLNETDSNNAPNLIHRCGAAIIETFVNDLGDAGTYGSAGNAIATIQGYMLPRLAQWVSGKTIIICPTKVDTSKGFWTQNSAIETVNSLIKSTFASRADVRVIDINAIIAPSNTLLSTYHTGDGHHLNAAGHAVKVAAIHAALTSLGVDY